MPTHFQLSWVRAVKEWNQNQAFQEDIYAIPKKGGESYKEVVSLREEFKRQHNVPQISEAPANEVKSKVESQVVDKFVPYVPSTLPGAISVGRRRRSIPDMAAKVIELQTLEELENYKARAEKQKVNTFAKTNIAHQEGYAAVINKINEKIAKISFGSTVAEQVENIKKTLFSKSSSIEEQKKAVRLALQILKYKENNIIQEARKPLQRELFIVLNQIKNNPNFKTYDLFGQSPASGKPMSRSHDLSEAAKGIPVFDKTIVDVVMEEEKRAEKARKKAEKERDMRLMIEEQERKKREKEEESKVDKNAIFAKWGKKSHRGIFYIKEELFELLKSHKITDAIDYEQKNGKKLTGFSGKDLKYAFPMIWNELNDF